MNIVINKFTKLIVLVTLILFLVIGYNALLLTNMANYVNSITNHPEYIYWFVSISLGLFMIILFKCIDNFSIKKKKILKYGIILFLLIVQFIMLVDLGFVQVTDPYYVNDQARALAFGFDKILDYNTTSYFTMYSNNNFCVLLVSLLTKFFSIFNMTSYNDYLVLFNTFLIDLSIFLTYKVAKELKNEDFALKTLIVSVLNPFNYLFIFWTYTCTYSLPFMIGIIYIVILMKKQKSINYKFIILSILWGIVAIIGYLIRPVIVIPIIAIMIMVFIYVIDNYKYVKGFIRKYFKRVCILVILFLFFTISCYKIINLNINKFATDSENCFPITHWIMMGLHGNGGVTSEDNNFTLSYETKEEKKAANIKEIKETLKEYGVSGLVNHLIIKLPVTWSDGVSGYTFRAGYLNKTSKLHQFLYGDKNDFVIIYCQAFRILMIFLVILNLINQYKTKKMDYRFLFTLTLFGAILFYLIWEAKNVYSLPFIPFMIILASDSLNLINRTIMKRKNKESSFIKKIGVLCIILTIISFISLEQSFTSKISVWYDYRIKVQLDLEQFVSDVSLNNNIIKQEFYVSRNFNYISLTGKKITDNDTDYDIKIYNNSKEIASFTVSCKDIVDGKIKLPIGYQFVNKKTKYLIVISPSVKGKDDSIAWGYRLSKATDQYQGKLVVYDKEIASDLALSVYDEYNGAYLSKVEYYFVLLIIILFEFFAIRFFSKEN